MAFPATNTGNILVVDDTIENLNLLSSILEQEGYEVRPVPDGQMALQAALAEPPDLVLLDINMSPLNGYEVCERLKQEPTTADVPIIFVSALDEALDKVRAFSLGAVDYVTKPFQMPELLARVKTHLQLQRTRLALDHSYQQLRQLEAMRDELVHMVVHDLRSPLSALIYSLSFMSDALEGKVQREVMQDIGVAETAARTMVGMANDLLDVSRLESAHFPVHHAHADLLEVVRAAVENVRRMQPGREVLIEGAGPVFGQFDVTLIRRVVENLVGNGLKHTPPDQPLRVEAVGLGELRVVVTDHGAGVPEEYREKIFQKFGATRARNDGAYHSVGLGLAFCKLAVEAHGGRIGVESANSTGAGSAFWFAIPNMRSG